MKNDNNDGNNDENAEHRFVFEWVSACVCVCCINKYEMRILNVYTHCEFMNFHGIVKWAFYLTAWANESIGE